MDLKIHNESGEQQHYWSANFAFKWPITRQNCANVLSTNCFYFLQTRNSKRAFRFFNLMLNKKNIIKVAGGLTGSGKTSSKHSALWTCWAYFFLPNLNQCFYKFYIKANYLWFGVFLNATLPPFWYTAKWNVTHSMLPVKVQ